MSDEQSESGFTQLRVIRGSIDSLSVFEITDWELEIFERGAPGSTFFNFSSILLSVGFSFLACLITLTTSSNRIFTVMVVITVISLICGFVLLALWLKFGTSMSEVCKRVRARVPSIDSSPIETPPSSSGLNENEG